MARPVLSLVPEPSAIEDLERDVSIDRLELAVTISTVNDSGTVTTLASARRMAQTGIIQTIIGRCSDGYVDEPTSAAPMLTLTVDDSDRKIQNSGVFDFSIWAYPEGIHGPRFHLVHVTINDDGTLELQFEHEIVALMRLDDKPIKVSRGSMTRAHFIWRKLVAPIATEVRFVSPQMDVKQRVAKPSTEDQVDKGGRKPGKGFSTDAIITIKGVPADRAQKRNLERALGVAADLKAGPRATITMLCLGIGESSFRSVRNSEGSDYGGVFQGRVVENAYGPKWFNLDDTEKEAHYALKGGKGYQQGGIIYNTRHHPSMPVGEICWRVGGNLSNFGGNTVKATGFYEQHKAEAEAIIRAWQGGGGSFGGGDTYWKRAEFTRGQPGQTHEDSWGAAIRLANEVRWRFFIVGKHTIYFVHDMELIRGLPRYFVTPTSEGFVKLNADVEVGGRYVLRHGQKQARPSEATMIVRADRWAVRPGTKLVLSDFGPATGEWLVDSTRRSLFDAEMEVNLRKPQKKLPEPRSQLMRRKDRSGTGAVGGASTDQILNPKGSDAIDRVYAAAKAIDARNLPYGPGGHGLRWREAASAPSMDCSSSTSMALHAGGFMDAVSGPVVSSWFLTWGKPGRGKEMTVWVKPGSGGDGHVFIEFHGRTMRRFDTVPAGSGGRGPHLRSNGPDYIAGRIGPGGYQPRHWPIRDETKSVPISHANKVGHGV